MYSSSSATTTPDTTTSLLPITTTTTTTTTTTIKSSYGAFICEAVLYARGCTYFEDFKARILILVKKLKTQFFKDLMYHFWGAIFGKKQRPKFRGLKTTLEHF